MLCSLLCLNLVEVNTEVIAMKAFFCYIRRLEEGGVNFGCSWPQKGGRGDSACNKPAEIGEFQ